MAVEYRNADGAAGCTPDAKEDKTDRFQALMMLDLGLTRMEDLATEGTNRVRHAIFSSKSTDPSRIKDPGHGWHDAIIQGAFDDDDALGVKGLDTIANGRLHDHRTSSFQHNKPLRGMLGDGSLPPSLASFQAQERAKKQPGNYDPTQPNRTHRRGGRPENRLNPVHAGLAIGQKISKLGALLPPGASIIRWDPKAENGQFPKSPALLKAVEKDPVSTTNQSHSPTALITTSLSCEPVVNSLPGIEPPKPQQQVSVPPSRKPAENQCHAEEVDKPRQRQEADNKTNDHTTTIKSIPTNRSGLAKTIEVIVNKEVPAEVPPHLRNVPQTSQVLEIPMLEKLKEYLSTIGCRKTHQQDLVALPSQPGIRAISAIYDAPNGTSFWVLLTESGDVIRADIRDFIKPFQQGSMVLVRRGHESGVDVTQVVFESIGQATDFVKAAHITKSRVAKLPMEITTEAHEMRHVPKTRTNTNVAVAKTNSNEIRNSTIGGGHKTSLPAISGAVESLININSMEDQSENLNKNRQLRMAELSELDEDSFSPRIHCPAPDEVTLKETKDISEAFQGPELTQKPTSHVDAKSDYQRVPQRIFTVTNQYRNHERPREQSLTGDSAIDKLTPIREDKRETSENLSEIKKRLRDNVNISFKSNTPALSRDSLDLLSQIKEPHYKEILGYAQRIIDFHDYDATEASQFPSENEVILEVAIGFLTKPGTSFESRFSQLSQRNQIMVLVFIFSNLLFRRKHKRIIWTFEELLSLRNQCISPCLNILATLEIDSTKAEADREARAPDKYDSSEVQRIAGTDRDAKDQYIPAPSYNPNSEPEEIHTATPELATAKSVPPHLRHRALVPASPTADIVKESLDHGADKNSEQKNVSSVGRERQAKTEETDKFKGLGESRWAYALRSLDKAGLVRGRQRQSDGRTY